MNHYNIHNLSNKTKNKRSNNWNKKTYIYIYIIKTFYNPCMKISYLLDTNKNIIVHREEQRYEYYIAP